MSTCPPSRVAACPTEQTRKSPCARQHAPRSAIHARLTLLTLQQATCIGAWQQSGLTRRLSACSPSVTQTAISMHACAGQRTPASAQRCSRLRRAGPRAHQDGAPQRGAGGGVRRGLAVHGLEVEIVDQARVVRGHVGAQAGKLARQPLRAAPRRLRPRLPATQVVMCSDTRLSIRLSSIVSPTPGAVTHRLAPLLPDCAEGNGIARREPSMLA